MGFPLGRGEAKCMRCFAKLTYYPLVHVGRKPELFPLEMDYQWCWTWVEGKFCFMLEESCSQKSPVR